jgi:choline dehydrogenase-like flavoprotein
MIVDARSLGPDASLEADICIVGAGPAGITLALELVETGARILLLESGDEGWSTRGKGLSRGENADPHYPRLEWTRLRMFGGSSWSWRAHDLRARPLDDLDLVARPEIGREGWPVPPSALASHWDRATELCHLSSRGFETSDWEDRDAPSITGDPDLGTAMYLLGPSDAFTRRLEQFRTRSDITCVLNATVLELRTDGSRRRVDRLDATSGGGRTLSVRASWFALALGGIENARLLLLSRRDRRHAVGDDHGNVGRYFTEHPHIRTGALIPSRGTPAHTFSLYGEVERHDGRAIGFLRLSDQALRREALPASVWALHPATPELNSDVGRAITDVKATVRTHWRRTPATASRVATLARHPLRAASTLVGSHDVRAGRSEAPEYRLLGMFEQEPNPASRVLLGTRRDRYGQPVARLDWRLTDRDLVNIRRTQDVLSAALERAGVGRITQRFGEVSPQPLLGPGFHHMGTTRMATDPRQGVVDTDCRIHGTTNLFVAGSSIFPTCGASNPTLTLLAVTLRLADHLRSLLRDG